MKKYEFLFLAVRPPCCRIYGNAQQAAPAAALPPFSPHPCFIGPGPDTLGLCNNILSPSLPGADSVLVSSPSLDSLCSNNNFGPAGATAIAAPLALLTSLQTVDLRCLRTAQHFPMATANGQCPPRSTPLASPIATATMIASPDRFPTLFMPLVSSDATKGHFPSNGYLYHLVKLVRIGWIQLGYYATSSPNPHSPLTSPFFSNFPHPLLLSPARRIGVKESSDTRAWFHLPLRWWVDSPTGSTAAIAAAAACAVMRRHRHCRVLSSWRQSLLPVP